MLRTFIAIELPEDIRARLGELIRQMIPASGRAVKWVDPKSIHLTIKFLGDTPAEKIQTIIQALQSSCESLPEFELVVEGKGMFPNPARPRVFWVGIRKSDPLIRLQKLVDQSTQRLGFPGEDRPFSGHLTLGRIAPSATLEESRSVSAAFAGLEVGVLGTMPVRQVILFRSDLLPTGAVYTMLGVGRLLKNG
ncbi:MAG TPA: RNA 2',3'-cyclic phosphodiesterase [Anaerolineaceae bacterium]